MEGKTFFWDGLEVIGLDNFTWSVLNSDFSSIEVSDHEVDASQSLNQSDFVFNEKVSTLTLKALVRLLLHHNHDIACLLSWELISFSMESVLAIVW